MKWRSGINIWKGETTLSSGFSNMYRSNSVRVKLLLEKIKPWFSTLNVNAYLYCIACFLICWHCSLCCTYLYSLTFSWLVVWTRKRWRRWNDGYGDVMRRIDQEVAQVHSSCNAQSLLSVFCRTYASFLLEKEKNKRENTFYIKLIFYRKGILDTW